MQKALRILMIDDDEEDFLLTRDTLRDMRHVRIALDWEPSPRKALETARKSEYDVYLVDYRIGADSGLDFIRDAVAGGCVAPLILLTGQNDEEVDEMALKAGASDYLVKSGINGQVLERSIRYSLEQARAMRQIKALNSTLEKKVHDRTLVLEEALQEIEKSREELKHALSKERELNEMKSRFVSMASHEFRTPLATILSSLALVSRYKEPGQEEQQKKHIDRIKSSVSNMTDILNDFLSISKLEEGKVETAPEPTLVCEVVSDIVQEMKVNVRQGQDIVLECESEFEPVLTDGKLLRNVLINLLSNAIKFSPENSPITVKMVKENKDIVITVSDKGLGISPEDQEHLFGRFFRGGNVTHIQGTGLGLSIVARYIALLNGSIGCQSELNKGTSFIIKLPAQ